MKAIRINETGGPEVMHLEEIDTPNVQKPGYYRLLAQFMVTTCRPRGDCCIRIDAVSQCRDS